MSKETNLDEITKCSKKLLGIIPILFCFKFKVFRCCKIFEIEVKLFMVEILFTERFNQSSEFGSDSGISVRPELEQSATNAFCSPLK